MTSEENVVGVVAGILSNLAKGHEPNKAQTIPNGTKGESITLPGPDNIAKSTLEQELSALASRISNLEAKAGVNGDIVRSPSLHQQRRSLPPSPREDLLDPQQPRKHHARHSSTTSAAKTGAQPTSGESQAGWMIKDMLSNSSNFAGVANEQNQTVTHLTEDQTAQLRNHVSTQDATIKDLKATLDDLTSQLQDQKESNEHAVRAGFKENDHLQRELGKHKQANEAFAKALREIGTIVTAVADGNLSQKVLIHAIELDPEITNFKRTINRMVDQLQQFASEVTHLAKAVGTEGELGGQADCPLVSGVWLDLTKNVNIMAENLTEQVREIAVVTTAVAHGDLSRKIERPANGEVLQLQQTINLMVDQLRIFATEVTKVARDVGTEGVLGGQAHIEGVQGMWNDLTINVNAMANNLTTQVRDIAKVTTAVARGDLTQKVSAVCKGEILELKLTINSMVDQLQQFAHQVTNLAQDVGTEGKLGGQALVPGVRGTWASLTDSVNVMAMKLTTQVREIAQVTTAVAKGDLSRKVGADVKGEILELKNTINTMVDRLRQFAMEVSKVAREVGTDGTLGGQATVDDVEGKWKDLTENVNTMAENLTSQVRNISEVTQAIAEGDMSRKIHVHAEGEMYLLKSTINEMVDRLDNWSLAVSRVAKEVGVDGKFGQQADTAGITGRWRVITVDVNTMATNLTSQVRAFGDITNAANSGDFSQEITITASGEMDLLKKKINQMVSGLRDSVEKNTKAREIAELANKTKSEFLANMSHEIRTPMNGIIGMTQLSLDSELTSYQREMLSTVYQLANSLLAIIDDILDISKIEANRMDIERIPFSVRKTVFNALKSLSVKANERRLNLTYSVDSSTKDFVIGDQVRLRQIVMNLVGNAIKFTEKGEVKVQICSVSQEGCGLDEYRIKFIVSDTGIGIRSDKLQVIFDTFQQADGSTTRRFGGTGLGLSISKKLVGLMGGDLWVESTVGEGSKFYFTCRYQLAPYHVSNVQSQLQPFKDHPVLFLDQDKSGCSEQVIQHLSELKLVPRVLKVNHERFSELPSPNGNGYGCVIVDNAETAGYLREIEKFKYIPVVMLAPVITVNFKSALEDGISSYMTTPCSVVDLGNALIPALEGRASPHKNEHSRSFDILLAEDNLVNQRLAVKILEKYHHNVTVANNGEEAFEKLKEKQFDVVLMDVQMPVMGGFEATAKIRQWEKENEVPRTPILALTAHAMLGDRERCLQAEMDDYLSKPLKQTQLIQCIVKYATMNGAMLEHKSKSRQKSVKYDPQTKAGGPEVTGQDQLRPPNARPGMGERGFTESPRGLESPRIVEEKSNPFEKMLLRAHSS